MIRVVLSPEAAYARLKEGTVLRSFLQKAELVKADPHHGQPLAKRLIPRDYQLAYGITNLFRVELAQYWRMLYTLVQLDGEPVAFVLDILDHKAYDRLFGYKGR